MDNGRQGGKGLTTARQTSGRQHNERRGAEDMTQGNWAADGTTRGGGGQQRTCAGGWQLLMAAGGGVHTQDILEIVPQNCT